jgi:hypothetical protein
MLFVVFLRGLALGLAFVLGGGIFDAEEGCAYLELFNFNVYMIQLRMLPAV